MRKLNQIFSFSLLAILISGCVTTAPAPVVAVTQTPELILSTVTAVQLQPSPTIAPTDIPTPAELPTALTPVGEQIQSIWMIDTQTGYSVWRTADGIRSLKQTADSGLTWQEMALPKELMAADRTTFDLLITANKSGPLLLVAASGEINDNTPRVYISANRDGQWQPASDMDTTGLESFFVSQVDLQDAATARMLAHVGAGMNHDYIAVYRSQDGGMNWTRLLDPYGDTSGVQVCYKHQMFFLDDQHGWLSGTCNGVAAGVYLYLTNDGGTSWEEVQLPVPNDKPDLFTDFNQVCESAFPQKDDSGALDLAMTCKDMNDQFGPLEGYTYHLPANSDRWQIQSYPGGTLMVISQTKWVAAGTKWEQSADGGATWEEMAVNFGLVDSFQVIGQNVWAITVKDDGSRSLVRSVDGGRNWIE